jgi:hypothetical protein
MTQVEQIYLHISSYDFTKCLYFSDEAKMEPNLVFPTSEKISITWATNMNSLDDEAEMLKL